ncbi:MAG: hypothetical protein GC205_07440 [Bacteroidetes bacterium]|nr:hypothetical protein [Bacteroidota bacterium]
MNVHHHSTLFFSGVLLASSIVAQPTVEWVEFTRGVSIATDAAENVYTADWEYNPAGDIYLTKRNTDGVLQWIVKYENTDNTRHEVATWVATDNNGDILVSGTIRSGYFSPVNAASLLMKFDPAGNLLWRQVYESSFDGSYTRKCLVDADNNIYVLGLGFGTVGMVTKVKKFAPDGTALWSYFDTGGIGAPLNFKFTLDNHLVLSGRFLFGSGGGYSKIDLDGNNVWNYPAGFSLTAGDVAGDADGNAYVVHGTSVGTGGVTVRKLSPAGTLLWEQPTTIAAFRVDVGTDGAPVISGFPNSGTPGAAFAKFSPTGTQLWENLDADGPGNALLLHAQMQLDENNNAYLAAGTLFSQALCKINADGTEGWTALTSGGYATGFAFGTTAAHIYLVGGATAKIVQETPCEAPIGLFSNNLTTTSARLNWTVVPGALAYEVQGRKASSATWRTKTVPGSKNKLLVSALVPGTNYVWRIRTVCDPAGAPSAYSPEQTFTTLVLREQQAQQAQQLGMTVNVFPNPVSTQLNLSGTSTDAEPDQVLTIRVLNSGGMLMATSEIAPVDGLGNYSLAVQEWPTGLYSVVWTNGTQSGSQSVVIMR